VCVYVCMYVCMYVMYVCMYLCMYIYKKKHKQIERESVCMVYVYGLCVCVWCVF